MRVLLAALVRQGDPVVSVADEILTANLVHADHGQLFVQEHPALPVNPLPLRTGARAEVAIEVAGAIQAAHGVVDGDGSDACMVLTR